MTAMQTMVLTYMSLVGGYIAVIFCLIQPWRFVIQGVTNQAQSSLGAMTGSRFVDIAPWPSGE